MISLQTLFNSFSILGKEQDEMRNKEGSFTVQKSMNLTDCEMISKVFFINILDLYKGRVQVSPKMIEFRFFSSKAHC